MRAHGVLVLQLGLLLHPSTGAAAMEWYSLQVDAFKIFSIGQTVEALKGQAVAGGTLNLAEVGWPETKGQGTGSAGSPGEGGLMPLGQLGTCFKWPQFICSITGVHYVCPCRHS